MQRQLYLVAYDIGDDDRLRQALRTVREFALGGQKSVFECYLAPNERAVLRRRLTALIDPQADRFLILRLDPRGKVRTLGIARPPADTGWFYVG